MYGKVNTKNNWVMDFDKIDSYVQPEISILDHSVLNDIDGLKHPTSENIAKWLWIRIKRKFKFESIEINRPRIGGCVFTGSAPLFQIQWSICSLIKTLDGFYLIEILHRLGYHLRDSKTCNPSHFSFTYFIIFLIFL